MIERGAADVMLVGGASATRLHPTALSFRGEALRFRGGEDPAGACRPFDAGRDGLVNGEGAAAFVIESRRHAQARGATIQARLLGCASRFEPRPDNGPLTGSAIRESIRSVLTAANLQPADIGHVNANGLSTVEHDRIEARAIRAALGDVPVTASKSLFGNIGGGAGAVELAASLLAIVHGAVPPTLNYTRPDPECPVNVVRSGPLTGVKPMALKLSQTVLGQAAVRFVIAADA